MAAEWPRKLGRNSVSPGERQRDCKAQPSPRLRGFEIEGSSQGRSGGPQASKAAAERSGGGDSNAIILDPDGQAPALDRQGK